MDPVFGTTIRRLTVELPAQSFAQIYAHNGWWNASAALFVHETGTDLVALDSATGNTVRTGVPDATQLGLVSFDPVDPDVWYFFQNADLRQFSIASGSTSVLKTFPAPVEPLGASVDWIDRTGRYFLVAYSGELHVWDRVDDEIYPQSIPFVLGGGWAGISPDGKYVVTAAGGFTSYEINHAGKTLSTSPTLFWNLCGDHADLVSANDGRTYLVAFECDAQGAVYRVDVTIPLVSDDQQRADNVMLLDTNIMEDSGHFSCASTGPNRDWCVVSIESNDDTFASQGAWRPYKQELIAVQVVPPFAVRRLAHHRSRSTNCPTCPVGGYYHQPKPSMSWDGRRVAYASNFGYNATPREYADIYTLDLSCAP